MCGARNLVSATCVADPVVVEAIAGSLESSGIVVVAGADGVRARDAALAAVRRTPSFEPRVANGDWRENGYLAGFEPLAFELIAAAETLRPALVERHEHSLKRLWPHRDSRAFRVPRDLTNTSSREERTRFYHHEYQNKLLVGLAEFVIDALNAFGRRIALIVEDADQLSATAVSLLEIFRRRAGEAQIAILLLDASGRGSFGDLPRVVLPPLTGEAFATLAPFQRLSPIQREALFSRSGGDVALAEALVGCNRAPEPGHPLGAHAILDLHIAGLDVATRLQMIGEDGPQTPARRLLLRRVLDSLPAEAADDFHIAQQQRATARYRAGDGPLAVGHALAVRDKRRRLEALTEPSEILMAIGLYDTWFAFFAGLFADRELWSYGSGDDATNGIFINAAFVLYAMGCTEPALAFIESFLARFPDSRFVPTALYASSMTYGRYQTPVNLPLAELFATRNLDLIEQKFAGFARYTYIKVFAENAYAYIKARQGRFEEALAICDRGNEQMLAVYGEDQFRLHRSILIYNTSQVYELVGDLARAEGRLRDAIDCDPYYAEYRNDLGNLLARAPGREAEALAAYARAIELSPPYYEAHLNRALLRAQLGDREGAEADLRRALQIKPAEWRALKELGNLRLQGGEAGLALSSYDKALQFETRDADLHANAGLAASLLGQSDRAIAHFQAALALNPKHACSYNNLAAELVGLSRPHEALPFARLAAKYGDDPDFLANLAGIEALCAESGRAPDAAA
jgi:tetratricopeptide (TPR) repeat protein